LRSEPGNASTLARVHLIIIPAMYEEAITTQLIALEHEHTLLPDAADADARQIDATGVVGCRKADMIHG
jgi:hypothetical protein